MLAVSYLLFLLSYSPKSFLNLIGLLLTRVNVGVSASGVSKGTVLGPYPKTPEERAAAAKKYNMTVEDYEPYPDNGEGLVVF